MRDWLRAILDAPPEPEADDVPTLIHQPRADQRVTVREIPPPPSRGVPRALPIVIVSLSFLLFAAVVALLILRVAD